MNCFRYSETPTNSSEMLDPSRAVVPVGKLLNAEVLGFDDESYIYITFIINPKIERTYQEMYEKMARSVNENRCLTEHLLLQERQCILKLEKPSERRGGIFVRAKILEVDPTAGFAKCLLIDDFVEMVVPRSQIYQTNADVLAYNQFSLKCQLADLECFLGYPFLQNFYREHLKKMGKAALGICTVTIEDQPGEVPTIRIIFPGSHQTFSSALQECIPVAGTMMYPPACVDAKVKLTHADGKKGMVWFQNRDGPQLIKVVEDVLIKFNAENYHPTWRSVDTSSWKAEYLSGYNSVSIYKAADGQCYRVKVNRLMEDRKMVVSFIDYGYEETVKGQDLYSAPLINENLCFIPPQCLSFLFAGTNRTDGAVDLLWESRPGNQREVFIRLKDYGVDINQAFRRRITPEADIFIQGLPNSFYQHEESFQVWNEAGPSGVKTGEAVNDSNGNGNAGSLNQGEAQNIAVVVPQFTWIVDRLTKQINEHRSSSSSNN